MRVVLHIPNPFLHVILVAEYFVPEKVSIVESLNVVVNLCHLLNIDVVVVMANYAVIHVIAAPI